MHVVVAMSGGVDSSVAALRLLRAGHEVTGVFLRNGVSASGSTSRPRQGCCSERDACDAEEVAGILGIPFYSLDHEQQFEAIVAAFVEDHARGLTPNPCVVCNHDLKFGELWRFARSIGAQGLATGHYARLESQPGPAGFALRRAVDRRKDQSYVLATVPPNVLRHALLPLGESEKEEVRAEAASAGLPVHAKAESQEICFVPSGDHRDVLRTRRPELFRPGRFIDLEGRIRGRHEGAAGFTVGQRHGLGIAEGGPWFVVETDPQAGTVVVGTREQAARLGGELVDLSLLDPAFSPESAADLTVQVRAHHSGAAAVLEVHGTAAWRVRFDSPVVVTPGQYGVVYVGDRVVASGRFARMGGLS